MKTARLRYSLCDIVIMYIRLKKHIFGAFATYFVCVCLCVCACVCMCVCVVLGACVSKCKSWRLCVDVLQWVCLYVCVRTQVINHSACLVRVI